jgi:PTH1 family peptidyl-tRNA hydrolase
VNLVADRKYFGLTGRYSHQGQDVRLLIPTTYMNRSGQAVAALAGFFRIKPEEILVAHDELDLPPGVAKLKQAAAMAVTTVARHHRATGQSEYFLPPAAWHRPPGRRQYGFKFRPGSCATRRTGKLDASIDFALGVLPDILAGEWNRAMKNLHSQKA